MEEHVYAAEPALAREDEAADEVSSRRAGEGGGALGAAPAAGGRRQRRGFLAYADLNEEIGRSVWAQLRLQLPGPGRRQRRDPVMVRTDEQKERFLRPLVEGETRSFFSMTEPDVSGADPTRLQTRAVLDGDDWVIDGHKWFSSGAEGAGSGS
jgi:alkylation response protein AidB-like acyl-CoA dehydrogenase